MISITPDNQAEFARAFYDRISGAYDMLADASEHRYRQDGIAALGIEPGTRPRILEIGFGTGNALIELSEAAGEGAVIRGIDISPGMQKIAAKKAAEKAPGADIEALVGDAKKLPFDDDSFDFAFMSFTLELFPDAEAPQVLNEIRRVLAGGGRLGVVNMALPGDAEHPSLLENAYVWMHRHFPHIVDCRPIDAPAWLEQAGFTVEVNRHEDMWTMPVAIVVGVA